jgi:putative transcriptional regulator
MQSLEGHFLVASPHLLDPNFVHAVILLVEHNEQGALGVVINRPTSKLVKDLWHDVGEAPCDSQRPVFLGGPVSGPLLAIHQQQSLGEAEILPGVYFAAKKANLDQLVQDDQRPFKIFVGHAGWAPGQLESELESGAWFATPAKSEDLFREETDLWAEVKNHIGDSLLQSVLKIKEIPSDPSLN